MRLSVIIPALNEAGTIMVTLNSLQALRTRGHEVIVVDGGSQDDTIALADLVADKVLQCESGRACQMNAGARASQFEVLWFLHAKTHSGIRGRGCGPLARLSH